MRKRGQCMGNSSAGAELTRMSPRIFLGTIIVSVSSEQLEGPTASSVDAFAVLVLVSTAGVD